MEVKTYRRQCQTPKASRQTCFETVFKDDDECEDGWQIK